MEPDDSLPHSQVTAICPNPEPARSSPYPHISSEDPSKYYPPIYAWVFKVVLFPQVSTTKLVYTSPLPFPIRATFLAHLILLGCITRKMMGDQYRSPQQLDAVTAKQTMPNT